MAVMDPASPFVLVSFLAVAPHTRRAVGLFLGGLAIAAVFNFPWLAKHLPVDQSQDSQLFLLVSQPTVMVVANLIAGALIVWGLVQMFFFATPQQRLVRTLISRGDFLGAADLTAKEGDLKTAFSLYTKARAWNEAARIALQRGRDEEAAGLLRRCGGHDLGEASHLFRRSGNIAAAQRCDRDLAEWLNSRGRFDEAVEAWMRAGELQRAAGAATLALKEGRFSSSHPSLPAARKAVEQIGDHRALAKLHEIEGNWSAAAHAWRSAGDHEHAAEIFRKAGMIHDAALAESAAGHHQEAAQLRIRQLKKLRDRVTLAEAGGKGGDEEIERVRRQIEREEEALVPLLTELGMRQEMIEIIGASGRAEEAVEKLVQQNEDSEAADLAINAQLWHVAAPLLEKLTRWGEASDLYELADDIPNAARCAERAGEDERALQLYRSLGMAEGTANCMARLGYLQDALQELHRSGFYNESLEILQNHPGPVPDIPDVILDLARWSKEHRSHEAAIACLQRAVIGVALQPKRLGPAIVLAEELFEAGERAAALAQLERILGYDYSCDAARELRIRILSDAEDDKASTQPAVPAADGGTETGLATQQRYEILSELGRGGMGVVYRARDTRLERDVAIKVLRTTSAEEATRLGQEAKAAATLNHPAIVTVHDFEAGFDGYFIAMEYVPGDPLEKLLKSNPERIRSLLAPLLTGLADAIAYAHEQRVIHRDLKPGNILVTPENEVKILDFGIAARLDRGEGATTTIAGTPFYMAPEQIRGHPPTPATDIYSFGATAFHLATGRPPFHKGDVIQAHLDKPAPDPLTLTPDLDPGLSLIILRCLEKEPHKRFASASDLRTALERLSR